MRKVCYITGTRADFGLMKNTLHMLQLDEDIELSLVVTGMHLSTDFGFTVTEIEDAGFHVLARVNVNLNDDSGCAMASNLGVMLQSFSEVLSDSRPDIVLLLGDRGEMLAAALAAVHLNIHVAHIHGGELSGTIDESIRHCISKLSHLHLVSTALSKERLVRMGEQEENIQVVGAPGLDGITESLSKSKKDLFAESGFTEDSPAALCVFHPVVQEIAESLEIFNYLMSKLREKGVQVIALLPNSDAGNKDIREALLNLAEQDWIDVRKHLSRDLFLNWVECCDFMIGNSSSGIIEAASFGTPVINLGSRQNHRERNANVLDVYDAAVELSDAIDNVLAKGKFPLNNVYGDGKASPRIVKALKEYSPTREKLNKVNAY